MSDWKPITQLIDAQLCCLGCDEPCKADTPARIVGDYLEVKCKCGTATQWPLRILPQTTRGLKQ